jgi:hypothetical protein
VKANSPYEATSTTELSLTVGDLVVVEKMDGEWWYGWKKGNMSLCGWFPSEYVDP